MRRLAAVGLSLGALALVGAGAGSTPAAPSCAPTLSDGAGPFGRGAPPRRASIGRGHILTGIVLSVDCRPVPGAQVQLWQASNRRGDYTRASSGTVVTDRSGRFRFEGPRPVPYSGRPPHIHLRVVARDHEVLVTRYVPLPGAKRGSIRVVLTPARL